MGAKIKMIDPSQIRYTPQEGEIIQSTVDKKLYIYKDGNWMTINMDSSGINVGLYDMNKQIIAQLPELTDDEINIKKVEVINNLHNIFKNSFYMLYGKELSYFTLFNIIRADSFGDEVVNCLINVGVIKAIDFAEPKDAVEIWVEDDNGPTCLYLFPYDNGLVKVGE